MAVKARFFPPSSIVVFIIMMTICLAQSTATTTTTADKKASPAARGQQQQQGHAMMPHELDLADLSLPPEVITEALFSQTDLLQDQLEQCEEMVRNNLKGDDTAETDGIEEVVEEELDDDGDDEEDEDHNDDHNDDDNDEVDAQDDLNRKIAQLAVNAFSHHDEEDSDNVNNSHVERDEHEYVDTAAVAANNASDNANASLPRKHGHGHGHDGKGKGAEEEEEEYVVHEYEDVADAEHVGGDEGLGGGGKKDSEHGPDEEKDSQQQQAEGKKTGKDGDDDDDDNDDDNAPHPQQHSQGQTNKHSNSNKENPGEEEEEEENHTPTHSPFTTIQIHHFESEANTPDSDAEEPQTPPEEVNITITTDAHNNNIIEDTSSESSKTSGANQNPPQQQQQEKDTTQDPSLLHARTTTLTTEDTRTSALQDNHGSTSTAAQPTERPHERTAPVQKAGNSEPQAGDSQEGRRAKRSVLLHQIVSKDVEGGRTLKNARNTIFGKDRIRRLAAPAQVGETEQRLQKPPFGSVEGEKKSSLEILGNMLKSVLDRFQGGSSLLMQQGRAVSESLEPPQSPDASNRNPTRRKNAGRVLKVVEDVLGSEKRVEKDALAVTKTAEKPSIRDVIQAAKNTPTRDVIKGLVAAEEEEEEEQKSAAPTTLAVIQMAEKFLQTHPPSGRRTSDGMGVHRMLATSRTSGGDGRRGAERGLLLLPRSSSSRQRRRSRRSVLGQGLSPERYVPLIEQLVERLNYLQHSVGVCHMLLPAGHQPPANRTLG